MRSSGALSSTVVAVQLALGALASPPVWAEAEDEAQRAAAGAAWLDGPEVPLEEEALRNPSPPRESGRAQEPLNPPPHPPDPWIVATPPLPAPPVDLRFSTLLTRDELRRFGDLSFTAPLVVVPGLHFERSLARGERPSLRGLSQQHLLVRLDGVPLAPSSTWPRFPLLGMLDPDGVQRVIVRHGARPAAIGGNTAAAGVLEIETVPPPVELGEGVPLTGSLRAGYGGPALEKAILAAASTGFGRVRVALSAGAFDYDDLALGRFAGMLESFGAVGGHLGARVDVTPRAGLRVFAAWRSARHGDDPYPALCLPNEEGDVRDCTRVSERALDLVYAGLDTGDALFGWRLDTRVRAHAQHLGEKTERNGAAVVTHEIADDFAYRGGGLVDLWLTPPRLTLLGDTALGTRLHLSAELLRDRVLSRHRARSRRLVNAEPPDAFREDPTRASGIEGSLLDSAALGLGGRAGFSFLSAELSARVVVERLFAPEGRASRFPPPFLAEDSLSLLAALTLEARILEELALFVAFTRSARGDTLYARTLGPVPAAETPFATSPAPALSGASDFLEHGAELGVRYALSWLQVETVLYAARRAGELTAGVDARDESGVLRLVPGPERTVLGVEGRLRYRTFVDGLSGLATLGALSVDEGAPPWELFGDTPAVPASAVTPPFGVLVLDYRPEASWFGAYTRVRYALPQARLSPVEETDPALCPEAARDPQTSPCRGSAGIALFDLGAGFSPSERLRVDALVENVLDAPWRLFGHELPGGGLGARVTLTLAL